MEEMQEYHYIERIGFWPRCWASLLDGLIYLIILLFLAKIVFGISILEYWMSLPSEESTMYDSSFRNYRITSNIIGYSYILIEAFAGAFVGKMLLGIKIKKQDGSEGNIALYMKRWAVKNCGVFFIILATLTGLFFFKYVNMICVLIITVGDFFVFASDKQGFHDMLAKTAVFRK